ncbi:MAG: flagellar hook-associated protein FlgK [Proteobacteria bacterium]|nr:flagellar hook-associated protein FlgK [Pseudomonadota bacterium]
MSGLFHTLNIGAESLYASRQGVDTAGHNIANAQTEGFSRQRANLEQRIPTESRGVVIGNGVFVKNITRAHDKFLEKQINETNQNLGQSDARFEAMKPLEGIYSPELNSTLSSELDRFFNSLQDLSNFPEELPIRTAVRENAQNLVDAFHRIDSSLKTQREDVNSRIQGEVAEVSTLLKEIAKLNIAIKTAETTSNPEVSDLLDQQDKMLRDLTKRVDVNYYRGELGMVVVRGPQETLLVDRGFPARFDVVKKADGSKMFDVIVEDGSVHHPTTVTDIMKRGRLSGLIDVRDKVIPTMLEHNNEMARTIADQLNSIHQQGFGLKDFKETTGRNFFDLGLDRATAAENIRLDGIIVESTDAISVASSPNAPGDNVLANQMLRLKEKKIMGEAQSTFQDAVILSLAYLWMRKQLIF